MGEEQDPGQGSGPTEATTERVAAILVADAVGYSRLMAADERATVAALDQARKIFRQHVESSKGRVVDTAGDSVLAVFETTSGAVRASVAIQDGLAALNADVPQERKMHFRIGIHLGDIIEKPSDGSVYGDGVNVAARLEALSEPGGITVSGSVHDSIRGRLEVGFAFLGEQEGKNLSEPVRAYRLLPAGVPERAAEQRKGVGRKPMLLAIVGIGALAVIGLAIWWNTSATSRPDSVTEETVRLDESILAMPTGPAIAVLPFQSISDDPSHQHLADGLTKDISNALTGFRDFRVLGRASTEQYRDRDTEVGAIGKELGVGFILDGSVQRAEQTIRVNVELLDATDGVQLWTETFDRQLTASNIFEIQDQITETVANLLADNFGIIARRLATAVAGKKTSSLSSYECTLLANQYNLLGEPTSHRRAVECLEATIVSDPDYAEAYGYLAELYLDDYAMGFNTVEDPIDKALSLAQTAIRLDPNSQQARWGIAYSHFHRKEQQAFLDEAMKIVQINPNNAFWLGAVGWGMTLAGEYDAGKALMHKSMELNPSYPGWYHAAICIERVHAEDWEGVVAESLKMQMPDFYWMNACLAAGYAELGRMTEASEQVKELLRNYPEFPDNAWDSLGAYIFSDDVVRAFIRALRKAGLDIPDETS